MIEFLNIFFSELSYNMYKKNCLILKRLKVGQFGFYLACKLFENIRIRCFFFNLLNTALGSVFYEDAM